MIPADFKYSTLGGPDRDYTAFEAWEDQTNGILTFGECLDIYCSEVGQLDVVLDGAATAPDYYRLIRLIGDPKDIKITVLEKYSRVEVLPSLIPKFDSKSSIADLGYRARITVGGRDKAKFAPNINASFTRKVADEFYLNINDRGQVVDKEAPALSDNLAEIKAGGRTSRYYVREDGTLEYEIVLDAPPPEGYIELEIKCSPGLTFHHQPELTPEEIADGCVRPDNIINGYVIYCDQANGPYRTGQLGVIERAWVRDVNWKQAWTTQDITVKAGRGLWRIKTPTDPALYPVCVGPVLGYDTAPSSTWASFGANAIIATYATMPAVDGVSSVIHIYGANQYHNLGMYDHDAVNNQPGSLMGYAEATNGNGTVASVALVESLSASTKYWLAQQPKVNSNYKYNSVADASRLSGPGSYAMPATWQPYVPSHVWARRMGIWVDYDEVHAPDAPSNPTPADTATGVAAGDVTLECDVTDDNGDAMDVTFYDASDDSLIGTDAGVASGGTATVTWAGRAAGTLYTWYAKANDGTDITTGPDWTFTTASGNNIFNFNMDLGISL